MVVGWGPTVVVVRRVGLGRRGTGLEGVEVVQGVSTPLTRV